MKINQQILRRALPPQYIWSGFRRQGCKLGAVNYVKNNHCSTVTKLLMLLIKIYIARLSAWTCATSRPSTLLLLLIVNQLLNVAYKPAQLGPVRSGNRGADKPMLLVLCRISFLCPIFQRSVRSARSIPFMDRIHTSNRWQSRQDSEMFLCSLGRESPSRCHERATLSNCSYLSHLIRRRAAALQKNGFWIGRWGVLVW